MTTAFQDYVHLKFQVYNSLFLTLPFGDILQTGILLPLLGMKSRKDLETGKSPSLIIEEFFDEHVPDDSESQVDLLFAFIKYVERQVVLFDAVEDAAFQHVHDLEGPGTLKDELVRVAFEGNTDLMRQKLNDFSLRIVLTAHPTQFYPGRILSVISDLDMAIRDDDLSEINELLLQLGKTPMLQKEKPTPYTEAVRLIWFIENVFYFSISELISEIASGLEVEHLEMPLENLLRIGFWPGGDRDGNPYVDAETTLRVAGRLKRTAMICFYRDLRSLKRKLTYKSVYRPINEISAKLSAAIADSNTGYQSADELLDDLYAIRESVAEQGLDKALEYLDQFVARVRIFGFHLATVDIRQDSSIHDALMDHILNETGRKDEWVGLDEDDQLHYLERLNFSPDEIDIGDSVQRDVFESIECMREIVRRNGERGCQRYIISNSQSRLHIMQVYHMIRWTHGTVDFDVTPLFETVADLANGAVIMNSLYNDDTYSRHLMKRNNTQFIMLGFSDGTKDGGYMQANWSIYKAKETITEVSRDNGIKVIFFDGRGGPPARGGGKSNKFYSSLGPTIEDKEVQLTIQGQTISSNFGTTISARYNLEQLLSAGLENSLFNDENKALEGGSREVLDEIARISFESYSDFKFDEDFLPYLEQMGTLPYYAMTNIASRPVKRKGSGKTELKSLRAIPFVGSWNQMKQNVPGFYGLGTALKVFEERGDLHRVKALYGQSLFFRTLMENCMMSLSKCYFPLTQYLSDHADFGRIWNKIHGEYLLTRRLVLEISGQSSLMELAPNARDSVKLRESLVLPILVIQQYALQKIRDLEESGKDDEAQKYHTMVMRTMFAIINAGRNSA